MKILVFVLITIAEVLSKSDFYDLPTEEVDLVEYNSDTNFINIIRMKELYEKKINVPDGELVLLCEIFPELYEILPLEKNLLDRYIPWNKEKIEIFFEDYPILKFFMSLLRFEYNHKKSKVAVSFFVKKSYYDSTEKNWGKVNIDQKNIKFVSSFTGDYYGFLWQKRLLHIKPYDWLSMEVGNFNPFEDNWLCYGFFPNYTNSNLLENWLYGGSNFWNGFKFTIGKRHNKSALTPEFSYFSHNRLTEKINEFRFSLLHRKNFKIFTSASRLLLDTLVSIKKDLLYFHGNIILNINNLTSYFSFYLEEKNWKCIPFSFINIFKDSDIKSTIHILHIPQNFDAPRSYILNKYIDNFEEDGKNEKPLSIIKLNFSGKISENFYYTPATEFVFNNFNINSYNLQVRANTGFGVTKHNIILTYKKYDNGNNKIVTENIIHCDFNRIVIETGCRYYIVTPDYYNKMRISLITFLNLSKYLQEEFSGKIILEEGKIKEIILGTKHKFNFMNHTYSEIFFEKKIKSIICKDGLEIRFNTIIFF